jgi:hypothetical protein
MAMSDHMMSMDEFRAEMERYRIDHDRQGAELGDPYLVFDRLRRLYSKFDANERNMADQVFCEWALSNDNDLRYVAKSMIR